MARAIAHGRTKVIAFSDPTAMSLLAAEQQAEVERIRQGPRPKEWRARFRYEHLLKESQMMVARTVAIDGELRNADVPQVVILGAGLDGRAWRMRELRKLSCSRSTILTLNCRSASGSLHSRWKLAKSASFLWISGTAIWRKRWRPRGMILACQRRGSGKAS